MLDWEVGDFTAWVSIDSCPPFPINIYKEDDQWTYKVHRDNITPTERSQIELFVKDTTAMMHTTWRPNMKKRLAWDASLLAQRKKKK